MSKIAIVVGTRPEAIKLIPVYQALKSKMGEASVILISTGQHKEMLEQVFSLFDVKANVDMAVMEENQSLNQLISKIFNRLDQVLQVEGVSSLVVQGDTSTAMASAIVAFNLQLDVFHVEAGLRSGDMASPFPEEGNRKLISALADLNFTPTPIATQNLVHEGNDLERIKQVGNTVIDAVEHLKSKLLSNEAYFKSKFQNLQLHENEFVLITCHRRESFGKGIQEICKAIEVLSKAHPAIKFVYPVHLNPKVKEVVTEKLSHLENVHLIAPLAYDQMLYLISKCKFVLTDSGGIQEEAPSFGKPCLVMRNTTERTEGIQSGCAKLVGNQKDMIVEWTSKLIEDPTVCSAMRPISNPYGDGQASVRIAQFIEDHLNN